MDVTLLLAAHAAVLGLMTTYCIEDYKLLVAAIKNKEWEPFINKTACLPVAFVLLALSPINLPIFAGLAGKVIASICISALASDYIYPVTKRLKGAKKEVCDTIVGLSTPKEAPSVADVQGTISEPSDKENIEAVLREVVDEYKNSTAPTEALTTLLTSKLSGKGG